MTDTKYFYIEAEKAKDHLRVLLYMNKGPKKDKVIKILEDLEEVIDTLDREVLDEEIEAEKKNKN